jgi:hypothetical protein
MACKGDGTVWSLQFASCMAYMDINHAASGSCFEVEILLSSTDLLWLSGGGNSSVLTIRKHIPRRDSP